MAAQIIAIDSIFFEFSILSDRGSGLNGRGLAFIVQCLLISNDDLLESYSASLMLKNDLFSLRHHYCKPLDMQQCMLLLVPCMSKLTGAFDTFSLKS